MEGLEVIALERDDSLLCPAYEAFEARLCDGQTAILQAVFAGASEGEAITIESCCSFTGSSSLRAPGACGSNWTQQALRGAECSTESSPMLWDNEWNPALSSSSAHSSDSCDEDVSRLRPVGVAAMLGGSSRLVARTKARRVHKPKQPDQGRSTKRARHSADAKAGADAPSRALPSKKAATAAASSTFTGVLRPFDTVKDYGSTALEALNAKVFKAWRLA